MGKINKLIISLSLLPVNLFSVFSVSMVKASEPISNAQSMVETFLTYAFMGFIGIMLFYFFLAVVFRIFKAVADWNTKKSSFVFDMFTNDLAQTKRGADSKFKRRNPKTLFLTWKRSPVVLNTTSGFVELGEYNGEGIKKENFFMLSIRKKISLFKSHEYIVIFPMSISKIAIKKTTTSLGSSVLLDCEHIDSVLNTDYYYIPLIYDSNKKREGKFLDFSNMIHKEYIEPTILRDMITENIQQTRKLVIESVEANPNLNFKRRGQD